MEVVSSAPLPYQPWAGLLTNSSHIVYIAVIAAYFVLIYFYFPETKSVPFPDDM
jgi:hypothetical protein